jgi:hypothetical protein
MPLRYSQDVQCEGNTMAGKKDSASSRLKRLICLSAYYGRVKLPAAKKKIMKDW